jgi:hypothetical protein
MAAVNVINAKKPFIVTSRSEVNWSRMNPEPALKVGVVRTGWKLRFEVRPAAAIPVGVASFSQYAAASSQSYALDVIFSFMAFSHALHMREISRGKSLDM